eukprot:CAMPEP_0113856298 /NCGR_PEP_ID=MMETSP0372-20130328/9081_1 /TAXON_ID=340204 /ORGANISM="Lankesteria abbotti" /LENGTH=86 /DNA_ID=CAMNT_0000831129 /DNA_START=455 /DNA_END=715 /DNA_ORIENTATION=- /assembly_acc=CAM_ASM_000359
MDFSSASYINELQDLLDDPAAMYEERRQWSDLPRAREQVRSPEETSIKAEDVLREIRRMRKEMEEMKVQQEELVFNQPTTNNQFNT